MNRFTLIGMNNKKDPFLDTLIKKLINKEIKYIDKYSQYDIKITFTDNTKIDAWDSNRWYAWLSSGKITDSSGEIIYSWGNGRPSKKTMDLLYNKINKYYDNKY